MVEDKYQPARYKQAIPDGDKRSTSFNTINVAVFHSFLCVIHFLPVRAYYHDHHQEAPTLVRRPELVKRLLQEKNKTT
jgi:hypothetical protein